MSTNNNDHRHALSSHCSNCVHLLLLELFEEDLIFICTRGNWGREIFKLFSQGQIVVNKRVKIRNQAVCWLLTLMLLCLKGKNLFMHSKKLICMSSKFIHACSLKRHYKKDLSPRKHFPAPIPRTITLKLFFFNFILFLNFT